MKFCYFLTKIQLQNPKSSPETSIYEVNSCFSLNNFSLISIYSVYCYYYYYPSYIFPIYCNFSLTVIKNLLDYSWIIGKIATLFII